MIPVADIVQRVRHILQDEGVANIRWEDSELLAWLSDAVSQILVYRPDATATTSDMALVAGPKQRLPVDGNQLLDVVRNIKPDDKPGRSISWVSRGLLLIGMPAKKKTLYGISPLMTETRNHSTVTRQQMAASKLRSCIQKYLQRSLTRIMVRSILIGLILRHW